MKRHLLKPDVEDRARRLRRNSTDAEALIWRGLRESMPHEKWRRQVPLGPYFVDFVSHRAKLIVEVDGSQHAIAAEADATRTSFLNAQGYRVLRFWNNEVLQNLDGVLTVIAAALPSPLVGEGGSTSRMRGAQQSCAPASGRHPSPHPSPTSGEGDVVNPPVGVR